MDSEVGETADEAVGEACPVTRVEEVATGREGYHFHPITGDLGPTPYWPSPPYWEEVSRVVSDGERSELAVDTSSECGISPRGWVTGFRW